MAYITREDGERFIIPSYRDMLSAKKPSLLKREILLLSSSYGEYITLQRKSAEQFEVAFSNEPGYLLGECVWANFNRPIDMIYCEAIPNTSDAILVIVKNGSVYLDGSFPIDTIPEELVIFKTQKNSFDIYVYGDVPISNTVEEGKFSFDESSVNSFTTLDEPVFPTLKGVKAFQLQLIDNVLKMQGIGVFPTKQVITLAVVIGIIWFAYHHLTSSQNQSNIPTVLVNAVNPYQAYYQALSTPSPDAVVDEMGLRMDQLYSIPGWVPTTLHYSEGVITAKMISQGGRLNIIYDWAAKNGWSVLVLSEGISLSIPSHARVRSAPRTINSTNMVIATIIDRISYIMPGNHVKMGVVTDRKVYSETEINVDFNNVSPGGFLLIGAELKGLPMAVSDISLSFNNGFVTGTINMRLYGYTKG